MKPFPGRFCDAECADPAYHSHCGPCAREHRWRATVLSMKQHAISVDHAAYTVTVNGRIADVPREEIDAACAQANVRCTYELVDEHTYRVVPTGMKRFTTTHL